MSSVFLYSDPHFGHANICKFITYEGTPLRPWDDVNEMDEEMVQRYNEAVGPKDKTYFLGDVVINRKNLTILDRLNGDKVLIKGNHDIFNLSDYTKYFRDIRGYHVMNGLILSHIPIHEASLGRFGTNVHGHLHGNRVMKANGFDKKTGTVTYGDQIDPRYWCACVEATDFRPILFEEAQKRIIEQGGTIGFKNGNGPTM